MTQSFFPRLKERLLKQIRKRLTYANVMSSIAVFVVLGGAAVAATQLPKNSVGSKQLKKNAVTKAKIKKGAIDASKVQDESLLSQDFKAGQLPAGPAGPKGDSGATGPEGTALAYATLDGGGNLIESRSKGIAKADVARDALGTYCFSQIPAAAKTAVATAYTSGLANTESDVFTAVGFSPAGSSPNWTGCSSNEDEVRVTVWDVSAATRTDQELTIWFDD